MSFLFFTRRTRRLLVVSQRHEELRLGQLLIGRHGGEQRGLDDLIGGGGGGQGGSGGRDGDLAELAGEGRRAETAVRLQADASILAEQRTEDCRGRQQTPDQLGLFVYTQRTRSTALRFGFATLLVYYYVYVTASDEKHVDSYRRRFETQVLSFPSVCLTVKAAALM